MAQVGVENKGIIHLFNNMFTSNSTINRNNLLNSQFYWMDLMRKMLRRSEDQKKKKIGEKKFKD